VGFRHKAGATAGNYHKAYEVTTYRECPKCQKNIKYWVIQITIALNCCRSGRLS